MPRRILEGEVVSDKQEKTVTVLVERKYMHPVYKKYIRKTDKYAAHDEHNQFKAGDMVQIQECRPISKRKRWTVITESKAEKLAARPGKAEAKKEAPKAAAKAEKPAAKKETKKKTK
ncbi:MAG: 30S ribosomal protein S17 [Alphaproteobacteria bacterium]